MSGVTYNAQSGTANAGTGTSVTYSIKLTEGSKFGFGTSADNIQLTWSGGTPTGVTWSFTSSTETISNGTTTTPTFTPTGTNPAFITLTVTTSGSTPAGTYDFTLVITDNNSFNGPWTSTGLNLLVNATAPTISYSGSPYTYYAGTAISSLTPTVTNNPTSYSISPALPAGLSFNTSTGVISGTPTVASAPVIYTVTATNASGSVTTTINITVLSPTISYAGSPYSYITGITISNLTPTVTGSPLSYSISPALPAGLSFNASTGVVSGTPTAVSSATTYTITANYAGSVTASTSISITITLAAPSISYTPSINVYTTGVAISSLTPANTGGAVASWSISPGLPAGLSFDTATGIISGTPTATSAATTYTVTATNSGGTGTTTVKITVNPPVPVISYSTPNVYVVGNAIASLSPTNTGGTATSWSISPALPLGLAFNTSTGVISGTPLAASAA
ncbi:MAG: putative Ig domain-containing protein, partial [Bacteroidetes bacterium]|nr:putative Ig domain-containing protein [Bacteroidota bacterium]